jgi:hypothetical protein
MREAGNILGQVVCTPFSKGSLVYVAGALPCASIVVSTNKQEVLMWLRLLSSIRYSDRVKLSYSY